MYKSIELIKESKLYKKMIKDSFGGVIYNIANLKEYDTTEKLELTLLWDTMPENEQESAGGILKGAMNFLKS